MGFEPRSPYEVSSLIYVGWGNLDVRFEPRSPYEVSSLICKSTYMCNAHRCFHTIPAHVHLLHHDFVSIFAQALFQMGPYLLKRFFASP